MVLGGDTHCRGAPEYRELVILHFLLPPLLCDLTFSRIEPTVELAPPLDQLGYDLLMNVAIQG